MQDMYHSKAPRGTILHGMLLASWLISRRLGLVEQTEA